MKKAVVLILVMCLLLPALAGCSGKEDKGKSGKSGGTVNESQETTFGLKPFKERQKLAIGTIPGSAETLLWHIADKLGWYDELNIDVEFVPFINGPELMEASSNWDIADTGAPGALVGMLGHDIKVIGMSDYEYNLGLFVRPDSKLINGTAEDWKGTHWLYPIGTNLSVIVGKALDKRGLTFDDIKSSNMEVTTALTAFHGGEGDGVAAWNILAFKAEDYGYVRIEDAKTLDVFDACTVVATDKALADKRDVIKAAWKIFYLGRKWMLESDANREKADEIFYEHCQEYGVAGSEDIARRSLDIFECPTLQECYDIMTDAAPDELGLYTSRELSKAERDILRTMDFLISQGKYSADDRNRILDGKYITPEIAVECMDEVKAEGINF